MATYLFVTKPEYTPEKVEDGFDNPWWSCSSTTRIDDQALIYITGIGIAYEWLVTSDAERDEEWRFVCDVQHSRTFTPEIPLQEIREHVTREEWAAPFTNFRGLRSIQIPEEVADRIRDLRP